MIIIIYYHHHYYHCHNHYHNHHRRHRHNHHHHHHHYHHHRKGQNPGHTKCEEHRERPYIDDEYYKYSKNIEWGWHHHRAFDEVLSLSS